ncbi:MAG: CidA/LrgA family protein [Butyrivibrio sp.]|uniref:CidA/LrgA family protein n=1 Tax=Butyrivibrio sp. TaxID=28121 RepID=UPI0025ED6FA0|nr:CidA/LrgA family protein [Butyrivibrio sp.]MCR5772769.1 CidA/LrgA family protein [Butyrivibrio sp.]
MKFIKQFLIILGFSYLGEVMKLILPLPIPASIYGMALLFAALLMGIIKYTDVKETGIFLIEIMPVMFIPAGVGLLTSWENLKPILLPVCIITVVTIVTVMLSTGWVSQRIIRKTGKKDE